MWNGNGGVELRWSDRVYAFGKEGGVADSQYGAWCEYEL